MSAKAKAESELERALLKMKAAGITLSFRPAPGAPESYGDRAMARIQAEANRLGMGEQA